MKSQQQDTNNLTDQDNLNISKEQTNEITQNFTAFTADKDVTGFDTYLLIGSDERNEETITTRGQVFGKRADVIILGMVIKKLKKQHYFLSVTGSNLCTESLKESMQLF